MKIRIIGAGPAGLYFAALMKQHDPSHDIVIYERNPRDATWGFGVVFSDRALEFLKGDDEQLYHYLTPHLENWPEITVVHNDTRIPIAGNGFASIGRLELLTLMYRYVEQLGVPIRFETEVNSLEEIGDADLVVGANGVASWIRAENEAKLGTTTDWRPNKFIWYGTTKAFNSLTLTFRETGQGVFCAHHYRYRPDMSTFLVEVEEDTWRRAAHGPFFHRLGHPAGHGRRRCAVQGLQGNRRRRGACPRALSRTAPAPHAQDLGGGQCQHRVVRKNG
ncbi:NAD(P)-binding protein [Pusillimonas noertemannii]|uniref:NAD(P)-binding protein n=1 Tax=Pusillimonas noertemannii TaxID=305977 RepID=UPI001A9C84F2|nr:NAD(P)-binding protein [Pusillimonas noertemannii]